MISRLRPPQVDDINAVLQNFSGTVGQEIFLGNSLLFYMSESIFGPASEIQYTQVFLRAGDTFTSMRTKLVRNGSASRNIRWGLYDQSDLTDINGVPQTRLAQTNQIDTNVANNTFITEALTASLFINTSGFYWIAFICDATQPVFKSTVTAEAGDQQVVYESSTGTTLPASAGTTNTADGSIFYASAVYA